MTKDFSSIMELKAIKEQQAKLSELENRLATPALHDFTQIAQLYECFKDILAERDFPPNIESVIQRKKFLFIVLFLFAPGYWPEEGCQTGYGQDWQGYSRMSRPVSYQTT